MLLEELWEKSDKNKDSHIFKIVGDVRKTFAVACAEAAIEIGQIL